MFILAPINVPSESRQQVPWETNHHNAIVLITLTHHISFKTTTLETAGLDQLVTVVGKPKKGDTVSVHIRGYYISDKGKRKEYQDTWHSEKQQKFKIGANQTLKGLEEGVDDMQLGEEATLEVTPDYGYGDQAHGGYSGTVPPNSNLVLDVTLMKIIRNGKTHLRKRPKDTSSAGLKCFYNCFRGH